MRTTMKIIAGTALAAVALTAVVTAVGASTTTHVLTVTRTTTADPAAIWELWANVPGRTRWDGGLESARIDGPFELGATGQVTLEGQAPTRFELVEVRPESAYTDRFFLPMGATMDWHHSMEELGGGLRAVTFRIEMTGPTSLPLSLLVRQILEAELPQTVDRLVEVAEHA